MYCRFLTVCLFLFVSIASLGQSKLGEVACVYVTSPNLDSSAAFYAKLGFPKIASNEFPVPWSQSSDGSLLIMMRKDTTKYVGLTYYVTNIDNVAKRLESQGITFTQKPREGDPIKRYYFKTPDDFNIMLASNVGAFSQPTGINMLNMGQLDLRSQEKYPNKQCGVFGEFCHPVNDLNKSIDYWKKLGFEVKTQMNTPYPWAILTDGLMLIGLHETKSFSYPAVTYFGINTEQRVQQLKGNGVTGFTEAMGKENVSLRTWEGLHFFLFTVGM